MEFNNIQSFLERFRKLEPEDRSIIEKSLHVLNTTFSIDLTKEELTYQKGSIFLKVHPTVRTEIFLRKKEIIDSINENLGKKTILNIV